MYSIDATKWLVIVGVVSALTLAIGFVTARISVGLSWIASEQQKGEIARLNKEAKDAGERAANALRDAGIANEKAAEANNSASKANERAQVLEGQNLLLRTDLETATTESRTKQAELATEQRKLSQEQRKTAQAQREADEARLALQRHLEKIAARQADRKLLSGFRRVEEITVDEIDRGNVWRVAVRYKPEDDEAFRFAQEISKALRVAGWYFDEDPTPITKDISIDPLMRYRVPSLRPGITIVIPPPEHAPFRPWLHTMATVLREDFTAAGFPPTVAVAESGAMTSITVIVGSKF